MKKWKKILLTVIPATLALSFTSLAGEWHLDMNGWWYENDDGSYLRNGWYWIDGDEDGLAECYYFGNKGYLINRFGQADGYEINADGAWTVNGEVQRKAVEVKTNNDPAALEVYTAAQAKNNELDSLDVNTEYEILMDMDGNAMDMGMELNMKMRGARSGKLEYVADGNMTMFGSEMPVQMFYTDGCYYMDMMGMKIKQAMPMDEALEAANSNMESVDVNSSMMKNLSMRTEGENTVLTYDVNSRYLNSFLEEAMGTMPTEEDGFRISYNVKEASGEIVIDRNGYYTKQTMVMDMDVEITELESDDTMTVRYRMDILMNVNNPGQEVTFELPSTEGYTDVETGYETLE